MSQVRCVLRVDDTNSVEESLHWTELREEDTEGMGRYDGFTLKKKIRDSRTDEETLLTTLEHASVLEYYRQVQRKKESVLSLGYRYFLGKATHS